MKRDYSLPQIIKSQDGRVGYVIAWLLGIPSSVLLVIFLIRGSLSPRLQQKTRPDGSDPAGPFNFWLSGQLALGFGTGTTLDTRATKCGGWPDGVYERDHFLADRFVMLAAVEPKLLALGGYAKRGDERGDLVDRKRPAETERRYEHERGEMHEKHVTAAVKQANVLGKDARGEHPENRAYPMAGKNVERVIHRGAVLERDRQVAEHRRDRADEQTLASRDITGRGRDGHKADDRADARTYRGNLAALGAIKE